MISLCLPYHNNPRMLAAHYRSLEALPAFLRAWIELVVCDDASDPAEAMPLPPFALNAQLFRIPGPHVPWSHRCASNIAAKHARGEWLLMTDVDHLVPDKTWRYLAQNFALLRAGGRDRTYTFNRENFDGSPYHYHPDSWLLHREHWERLKGYDERYRGHYGQNYAFIQRVEHYGPVERLPTALVRVSRDDIPDASERVLTRKSTEAKSAVAAIRRRVTADGSFFADTRYTAPYERVFP